MNDEALREIRRKLAATKTFNYDVYHGQDITNDCIPYEEALDEMSRLIAEDRERLESIPMVNDLDCPVCGSPTLILGDGGYVTCSYISCPNPNYSDALAKDRERVELEAQQNGVAWAIGVIDELHIDMPVSDRDFKGMKNTLRDRYKAETGVDPAPHYPVKAALTNKSKQDESK